MSSLKYAESDRPRGGVTRKSFRTNEVLLKAKLGTVKTVTRDLPDPGFIYGMYHTYGGGVPEGRLLVFYTGCRFSFPALVHVQPDVDARRIRGPDIKAMNRRASRVAVKANEQRSFRQANRIELKIKKLAPAHLPSMSNPNHAYGIPLVRDDDMDGVMRFAYANDWLKQNLEHQHNYQLPRPVFVPVKSNKTTDIRIENSCKMKEPSAPPPRFKLSRFKAVKHKVDNVQPIPLLRDERPPVFRRGKPLRPSTAPASSRELVPTGERKGPRPSSVAA